MSPTLIVALVLLAIIVVGAPIAYILWIFSQTKKHRKEVQGKLLVSYLDRVTTDEEIVLCDVVDKWKVVPPGGDKKKKASSENPHGYYLHYGAVKDQEVVDMAGNKIGVYSGSITTKAFWPIGKKPIIQAQVNHAYYTKGDPNPLNPFNSFLPVNTDVAVQVLADENSLQALLQHQRYDFESLFNAMASMGVTAKWQKYLVIAVAIVGLISLVGTIMSFIAMRG